MNLGNIGKALANQAIEGTKNTVMEALRPAEQKPTAPSPMVDNTGAAVLAQIQAMQRQLPEDQELAVIVPTATGEALRALEIFVPNPLVLVFAGYDSQGTVTRVIVPSERAQVTCRIVKVMAGARPARVNVLTPKPRVDVAAASPQAPAQPG